jgi:hypothetical protein
MRQLLFYCQPWKLQDSAGKDEGLLAAPRDSNPDMLIQSSLEHAENNENKTIGPAEPGKVLQNPHQVRTRKFRS